MPENNAGQPDGQKDANAQNQWPAYLVKQADGTFGIKTVQDKEEVIIPLEDAQVLLQKAGTADRRLAEAADFRKQNKHAVALYEDMNKALQGDEDAQARIMEFLGMTEDPVVAANQTRAPAQTPAQPQTVDPELVELLKAAKAFRAQTGVSLANALQLSYSQAQNTVEGELQTELKSIASLSETLKPFLSDSTKAQFLMDELVGQARSMLSSGAPYGPQTFTEVTRKVERKYKALGIQAKPVTTNPAPSEDASIATLIGLGPASTGVTSGGPGTTAERPKAVTPLSAGPGEYARNFASRFTHDLAQVLARKGEYGE